MVNKLKYVLVGILIGILTSGSVAAAGQGFFLQPFVVSYYFDGVEKQGSDQPQKYFNGRDYVPLAFNYNGTTYVPLRFVAESIGKEVGYDDINRVITIGQVPRDQKMVLLEDVAKWVEATFGIKPALEPPYGRPNYLDPVVVVKEINENSATVAYGEWATDNCGMAVFKKNASGQWIFERTLNLDY